MSEEAPVRRSPVAPADCNLAASFDVIGDRWSLLIIRSALYGVRRFGDFQVELAIPRTILSDRLAKLTRNGLMEKQAYREPGHRTRAEHVLTAKGRALRLPFMAMAEWGDHWLAGDRPPPLVLRSRSSGQRLHVALVDEAGRQVPENDQKPEFAKGILRDSRLSG